MSGTGGSFPTRNAVIGFVALAVLYVTFVAAYGVNGLWFDDWGFVSLVHAAQTGHLSLGLLWAQHNENRMAIPYLVMLAIALPTHYNTKVVMILDAVLFVGTFGVWLAIVSSYCQRRVTLPLVAVCGVVWFSLADWQNALWGFQLAWYLILGALMLMLLLLLNRSPDRSTDRPAHWCGGGGGGGVVLVGPGSAALASRAHLPGLGLAGTGAIAGTRRSANLAGRWCGRHGHLLHRLLGERV